MTWARSVLVAVIVAVMALVTFVDAAQQREQEATSAAAAVGQPVGWPDALIAADPQLASRILTEAAQVTGTNVVRTSVGEDGSGRRHVRHHLLLTRASSSMFEVLPLAQGRWPTREELRSGSAVATTTSVIPAENVGRPRVVGGGFDLTVAGMDAAWRILPTAGTYLVETADPDVAAQFADLIVIRLTQAGVVDLTAADLRTLVSANDAAAAELTELRLAVVLVVLAALVTALAERSRRTFAVRRLHGHGLIRAYRRLFGTLAAVWVGQAALSTAVLVAVMGPGTGSGDATATTMAQLAVVVATAIPGAMCAALVVRRQERRGLITGVKQR